MSNYPSPVENTLMLPGFEAGHFPGDVPADAHALPGDVGELILDHFCGGGGASLGIEIAIGMSPHIAVNHSPEAIAMHRVNHKSTRHYTENIWKVDPVRACGGIQVGMMWASPDCRFYSRARGGRPMPKKIRSLPWVIVKWAALVKPRIIFVENVSEFLEWGPLMRAPGTTREEDKWVRDPKRKGKTFRRWVRSLEAIGYAVECRVLNAADYGVPTSRSRVFIVARCDGRPIVWPEATHGPVDKQGNPQPGLLPYEPVSICIDWSKPCPSIFSPEERRRVGLKPVLAEKTMRRVANGLLRYVLRNKKPFIVRTGHWSNITGQGAGFRGQGVDEPLATVCATNDKAVVVPVLAKCADLEAVAPVASAASLDESRRPLVASFLAKHYGGVIGSSLDNPLSTITSVDHHSLVTASLIQYNGQSVGSLVTSPMPTQTSVPHHALLTSNLVKLRGQCSGASCAEPAPTITAQGTHIGEVRALLNRYFGDAGDGQKSRELLGVLEIDGELYQVVDVGLRMLEPDELLRAQFHPRLAKGYKLIGSKRSQIARIGNSVPPLVVSAIVAANYAPLGDEAGGVCGEERAA